MPRIRTLSKGVVTGVAVGAIAVLAAGTASAATQTYSAGPASYSCTFPAIPAQTVSISAHFDGPDTIPVNTSVTPANVGGSASITSIVHALLTAAGYDGIRGTADVPITVDNGSLSQPDASGLQIPEQIYPAGGGITVNINQASTSVIPTYTAPAAAGAVNFALGTTITANLEFHKAADGSWTPWTMTCTAPSGTSFTPSGTITAS
ncbi:DUF6801 domain-containing protein [Amycolatopsis benzoatilytica]|uniref:DUF6801 domain-containing protein n=1 Tax=Amycolatopsis benzoatilytica TaxID=346045 RepID=UPI0003620E77|nr:DUF6801 domain-containing protein [Amycolatopsis benzoatilytica]